jgi:hypothetical protein
MGLSALTDAERELVHRCLRAAVEGPFFPEWEFHALFGVSREEARAVLEAWPSIDDTDEVVFRTINNALNNLWGYPHGERDAWDLMIGVAPDEVSRVFAKWRGDHPDGDVFRIRKGTGDAE